MSKPPPKGDLEALAHARPPNPRITHSATATVAGIKTPAQPAQPVCSSKNPPKDNTQGQITLPATFRECLIKEASQSSPLHAIITALKHIISDGKLESRAEKQISEVIDFINIKEANEKDRLAEVVLCAKENTIHQNLCGDLKQMYSTIATQLNTIQETATEALSNSKKSNMDVQELKSEMRGLEMKVGKVTSATNQIATTTTAYRDAVLKAQAQPNKAGTDPKVLADME